MSVHELLSGKMARFAIALAIGTLATAGAFTPPPGLALRYSPASLSPTMRRSRPSGHLSPNIVQMIAPGDHLQIAEQATLLATSFAESAYTNPERYFPKVMTYPEGLVSGMKAYFNIFVPTFKARACLRVCSACVYSPASASASVPVSATLFLSAAMWVCHCVPADVCEDDRASTCRHSFCTGSTRSTWASCCLPWEDMARISAGTSAAVPRTNLKLPLCPHHLPAASQISASQQQRCMQRS